MSLLQPHLRRDFMELVLRLPWWVSLLCALASYLLLHPLTILQVPVNGGVLDTAVTAIGQLLADLAGVAQYLIPILFLVLTAVSVFLSWKRYDLRSSLAANLTGVGFRALCHKEMELLVAAAFRSRGYQVIEPKSDLIHAGFDLELIQSGEHRLVHLRNWKSSSLGAAPLKKLYARMRETGVHSLFVLISGRFSPDALSFASDKPIELIDGRALKTFVMTQEQSRPPGQFVIAFRQRMRTWPRMFEGFKRENKTRGPQHGNTFHGVDDTEHAVGNALGALISSEPDPRGTHSTRPSEKAKFEPPTLAPRIAQAMSTKRPRHHLRSPISIAPINTARIANTIGMVLSLGLIWTTFQWFKALPSTPVDTPWSLLGQGRQQADNHQTNTITGYSSAQKDDTPPLGQLDYGPDLTLSSSPETEPAAVIVEQEPVEIFRSVRELEDAFDARYVPPPACYARGSPDSLARCGNHRIRARRAFLASNGQTMVPSEPEHTQSLAPSSEPSEQLSSDDQSLSWETEPDWRHPPPPSSYDAKPEPIPDWRTESAQSPVPIPDWRYPQPPVDAYERPPSVRHDSVPDRYGEWWPPRDSTREQEWPRESDWTRPQKLNTGLQPQAPQYQDMGQEQYDRSGRERAGLQSSVESYPDSQRPQAPAWGENRDIVPRVQRQPVEEWLPRDLPVPERTWRDEQQLREQRFQPRNEAWREGTNTPDYWNNSDSGDTPEASIPDWRGDWKRQP